MGKCKCKWRKEGMVLDENCDKIIGNWFCDIDYYDEGIGCNSSCYGYSRNKDVNKNEDKQ